MGKKTVLKEWQKRAIKDIMAFVADRAVRLSVAIKGSAHE